MLHAHCACLTTRLPCSQPLLTAVAFICHLEISTLPNALHPPSISFSISVEPVECYKPQALCVSPLPLPSVSNCSRSTDSGLNSRFLFPAFKTPCPSPIALSAQQAHTRDLLVPLAPFFLFLLLRNPVDVTFSRKLSSSTKINYIE